MKTAKTLKKLVAAALLAVMTMALLSGCGSKDVSGNYSTTIRLADYMDDDEIAEMADMGASFFTDITMKWDLNLTEDKKFTFSVDTADLQTQIVNGFSDNAENMIKIQLEDSGITEDMYEDAAAALGYDDVDSMMAGLKNDFVGEIEDAFTGTLVDEFNDLAMSGSYTVAGSTVAFVGENEEGAGFDTATIVDENTLTVDFDYDGEESVLTFTK